MALKPTLQPRITQRISLTPGLRRGMQTLQTQSLDLHQELVRLSEVNPFLEVTLPTAPQGLGGIEILTPQTESLTQSLFRQIGLTQTPPQIAAIARFLAGDLNDDGYLDATNAELAEQLGVSEDQVQQAVTLLQTCEPAGIGARNLSECLELQLVDAGTDAKTAKAICAHLNPLFDQQWRQVEKATGIPRAQQDRLADLIRTLSPRPAANFNESAPPLVADLFVEPDGWGTFHVRTNTAVLPEVRLDKTLKANFDRTDKLIAAHFREAQEWISALDFRNVTLLRIARVIVARQQAYFQHGPKHMTPLKRAEIAEFLGLHPSTVGRAVAGKGLGFAGAVVPLSMFLSKAIIRKGQADTSAYAVQMKIRALIEQENPATPLSDLQITQELSREGVDISRRTVAKYRGCLKLPSSFKRTRQKTQN